jgi:hypothetical protein
MVYLILPPVLLGGILPLQVESVDDILNQIKSIGADFEWDFDNPKVVSLRQWQVLYELHSNRSLRQRLPHFVHGEKRVADARQNNMFRHLLPNNPNEAGNRSGTSLAFQRRKEDMIRKTIMKLDMTVMLESWNDLLWEVLEIFSLKRGQSISFPLLYLYSPRLEKSILKTLLSLKCSAA